MIKFKVLWWTITVRIYRTCPWCKDGNARDHRNHGCPLKEDDDDFLS